MTGTLANKPSTRFYILLCIFHWINLQCQDTECDDILQSTLYQENKLEDSLVEAFVEFDRTLVDDEIVTKLKDLAKRPESPVPPNVLRLARSQAAAEDDEDDGDIESAPVDCGM